MAKQEIPQFKYLIVNDNGTGKEEFMALFSDNWGVIKDYPTGNAVHFLLRKEPPVPVKPVIETVDNKIETGAPLVPPHMFGRRRR